MTPYYSHGGITIYHGDCRDLLPGLCADALITDPPYGTEGLGGGYGRRQLADPAGRVGHTIANDCDLSAWSECVPLVRAALPPDAWLLAFCAARKRRAAEDALLANGAELVGEIVWDKGAPGLGYTVRYAHETALVASWGSPKPYGGAVISVLRGGISQRAMNGRHPHEKPVAVLSALVDFAAPPTGTVLDPFMGSGTTLRAAKDQGRGAIGIEVEERWCEIAAKRLEQEVLDFGGVA